MDAVFEASLHEQSVDRHRPDIQRLRTEIRQILKASRCLATWLVCASMFYLLMTTCNWLFIDQKDYKQGFWGGAYDQLYYNYVVDIEEIKLLHGFLLLGVSLFIYNMMKRNQIMTRRQYWQLLFLTIGISLIYLIPVLYIAGHSATEVYGKDKVTFENFAQWSLMFMESADTNLFGMGVSVIIHMQIFMVIFSFQFITCAIKDAIKRLEQLRDGGRGNYTQVELNSILSRGNEDQVQFEMKPPADPTDA